MSTSRPLEDSERSTGLEGERGLAAEAIRSRLFPAVSAPPTIGRYTLLETLGRGGMGVVYAAYDADLDRKIAVKLLLGHRADTSASQRLVREAQGLAQLSHPNVVQVHEVGEHEGALFVAMEYVAGQTLRGWLDEGRERPWAERVAMLVQCGRGLEAAHAAKLIHRDFKPDNVIIGDDGHARVLDFGLVRGLASDPSEHSSESLVESEVSRDKSLALDETSVPDVESATPMRKGSRPSLDRSLTVAGTVMGTPAYMAPEQHRGQACDARADQFAFCVVAFEILTGGRPFEAPSYKHLRERVTRGDHEPLPGTAAPRAVREAILRGLATEPEDRWPTMGALLDRLERALAGPRRTGLAALAGGGVVALAGVGVAWSLGWGQAPTPCAIDEAALAPIWGEAVREGLRTRLEAGGSSAGPIRAATTIEALDDWAQRWLEGRVEACRATQVEQVQTEALLDRRVACLDRKRAEFGALVETLGEVADTTPDLAAMLVELPDLDACADTATLEGRSLPPRGAKRAYEALARARALVRAGQLERAKQAAAPASAPELEDYAPLVLAREGFEAELLLLAGRHDEGMAAMTEAIRGARQAKLTELELELQTRALAKVAGQWSKPELEAWLLADAEASLAALGRPDDPRAYELALARGKLAMQRGATQAALDHYLEARALAEARDQHLRSSELGLVLAETHAALGDLDAAGAEIEGALAEARRSWGERSPMVANLEFNAGVLAVDRGDIEAALARFEASRTIHTEILGPESLPVAEVAFVEANLVLAGVPGDFDAARREVEVASEVFAREYGETHEQTCRARFAVGMFHFYADAFDLALDAYRRALACVEQSLGPEHPDLVDFHASIGEAHTALGEHEQALAAYARAFAIIEAKLPADDPGRALPHLGRGRSRLALGEVEPAIADLQRGVEILEAHAGVHVHVLADLEFALAEALAEQGGNSARARELAERASARWRELGDSDRAAKIEAWLGSR